MLTHPRLHAVKLDEDRSFVHTLFFDVVWDREALGYLMALMTQWVYGRGTRTIASDDAELPRI